MAGAQCGHVSHWLSDGRASFQTVVEHFQNITRSGEDVNVDTMVAKKLFIACHGKQSDLRFNHGEMIHLLQEHDGQANVFSVKCHYPIPLYRDP